MSRDPSSGQQSQQEPPSEPALAVSEEELEDLRGLDRAVERIQRTGLPPAPYIMYVDAPTYNHGNSSHRYDWLRNTPFDPDEEHMQYQTWLFRDTSDSLLRLRGAHEEESRQREIAARTSGAPAPGTRSGASTPLSTLPAKKKISLNDYKSRAKATSQSTTPLGQAPSSNLRKDALKKESAAATGQPVSGAPVQSSANVAVAAPSVNISPPKDDTENSGKASISTDDIPEIGNTPSPGANKRNIDQATGGMHDASSSPLKKARGRSPDLARQSPLERPNSPLSNPAAEPSPPTFNRDSDHAAPSTKHKPPESQGQNSENDKGDLAGPGSDVPVESTASVPQMKSLKTDPVTLPPTSKHATRSWIPGARLNTDEDKTPPALSPPNASNIRWIQGSSSSSENAKVSGGSSQTSVSPDQPSTRREHASRLSSDRNGKQELVPQSKQKSGISRGEAGTTPAASKPSLKTGASLLSTSGRRASSPTRSTKPAITSTLQVKTDGEKTATSSAPKITRTVKVSGGSSTFFRNLEASTRPVAPGLALPASERAPGESKLVKLKYPKSRARDVERILKLKPTPTKAATTLEQGADTPKFSNDPDSRNQGRSSLLKPGTDTKRETGTDGHHTPQARKRSRDEEWAPPLGSEKRRRSAATTASASERDQSPLHGETSFAPINGVAAASGVTPPQELSESPAAQSSAKRRAASSTVASESSQSQAYNALKDEFEKQSALAKSLRKHMNENLPRLETATNETELNELKLLAVKGIESVLCWIQAFAINDRYQRDKQTSVRNWESLLPWAGTVTRACAKLPHLQGISALLRSVCCAMTLAAYSRLGPGSAGGLSSTDSGIMLRKVLDVSSNMQRYATESDRLLSPAEMKRAYPATFEERQSLPLGMATKPKLAVKISCVFLREWSEKEQVSWTQQLEEALEG